MKVLALIFAFLVAASPASSTATDLSPTPTVNVAPPAPQTSLETMGTMVPVLEERKAWRPPKWIRHYIHRHRRARHRHHPYYGYLANPESVRAHKSWIHEKHHPNAYRFTHTLAATDFARYCPNVGQGCGTKHKRTAPPAVPAEATTPEASIASAA